MTANAARSPMHGIWYAQSWGLMAYLRVISSLAGVIAPFRKRSAPPDPTAVERVLLNCGGHIGDAVMLTALLPSIRMHYPRAQLAVLCGNWSRAVFDGHSLVDQVFILEHWKLDRRPRGRMTKLLRYLRSTVQLVHRLRQQRFDLAIDPYPYFPNAALLLWLSRIPYTAGFTSGGAGALYDLAVPLRYRNAEITELQFDLLATLGLPRQPAAALHPKLAVDDSAWIALLALHPGLTGYYIVIHPGAGSAVKQWPLAHWQKFLDAQDQAEMQIVITGRGPGERALADGLVAGRRHVLSLVDQLDWTQFVAVIARSRAVLCVDSAAAHIAAAFSRPTAVIAPGITDSLIWRPLNAKCRTLTAAVPCSPCFRADGCSTMDCVRGVSANDAEDALALIARS